MYTQCLLSFFLILQVPSPVYNLNPTSYVSRSLRVYLPISRFLSSFLLSFYMSCVYYPHLCVCIEVCHMSSSFSLSISCLYTIVSFFLRENERWAPTTSRETSEKEKFAHLPAYQHYNIYYDCEDFSSSSSKKTMREWKKERWESEKARTHHPLALRWFRVKDDRNFTPYTRDTYAYIHIGRRTKRERVTILLALATIETKHAVGKRNRYIYIELLSERDRWCIYLST